MRIRCSGMLISGINDQRIWKQNWLNGYEITGPCRRMKVVAGPWFVWISLTHPVSFFFTLQNPLLLATGKPCFCSTPISPPFLLVVLTNDKCSFFPLPLALPPFTFSRLIYFSLKYSFGPLYFTLFSLTSLIFFKYLS